MMVSGISMRTEDVIAAARTLRLEGRLDEALRLLDALLGPGEADAGASLTSDSGAQQPRAQALDESQKAAALLARASIRDPLGRLDDALDDAAASLLLAVRCDEPSGQAGAAGIAAALALRKGQVGRALDLAVHALVAADDPRCGQRHATAAAGNAALLLELLGAPHNAATLLEATLDKVRGEAEVPVSLRAQLTASLALLRATALASRPAAITAQTLDQVERLAFALRDDPAAPAYHRRNLPRVVVTLLASCGRHREARQQLDALQTEPGVDDPEADMQTWRARSAVLLAEGDTRGALAAVNEALTIARRLGLGEREIDLLAARASCHRHLGDDQLAADDLAIALDRARTTASERVERLASQVLERADAERSRRAFKRRADDLEHMSELDALTGLANRRRFEREALRLGDKPVALLICDLDNFKSVNDRHGHQVGDQVLTRTAACLLSSIRAEDLVMRWGGEEFVLILGSTEPAVVAATAERLRRALANRDWQDLLGPGGKQTVSIGVAIGPLSDSCLLSRADAALYRAKEMGRNRVEVADPAT
jgi:two-component system, cell cycle response regulator